MDLPDRHMLIGMTLGALCGVAMGVIGPGSVVDVIADELAPAPFDASQLVKFEDRDYRIENEDWVSTEATATAVVKKIEAGVVSYATITTTATGTYSTDALFSRHVQYPGVTVTDVTKWPEPAFRFWSNGKWYGFRTAAGHSFTYYNSGKH